MLTKKIISDKLSSFYLDGEKIDIISKGSVKNIVIFDKEIVIDLEVVNPTLKSKNIIKENLHNYLKEHLNIEISLKINFQIASKPIENKIYNPLKKITNISNIIAVSSGKVVGSALTDMGFDVNVGPLFQTPSEAAEEAIKLNVDIIAASSLAAGHLTLVPKLRDELDNKGHSEIHIIVGGVIPKEDFSTLTDIGASAIFATGTNIINSAMEMLQIIESSNS